VHQAIGDVDDVENVVFVAKDERPHHCINAADLTITKLSNVGIEAMMLERPVASIVLDESTYSKELYGDGAEHFDDVDLMVEFLLSIVPEEEFEQFRADSLDRQQAHLDRLFERHDATERMTAVIDEITPP
jgi:CDP-glycerol glycerophosphotransferase (TagB/SpsB family)